MELIEDTHCDLMGDFASTPSSGYRVPRHRRRYDDIRLLHLSSLLLEVLKWIYQR